MSDNLQQALTKVSTKSLTQFSMKEIQDIATTGNLISLPPSARWQYYLWLCEQIVVDPKVMPFIFVEYKGKNPSVKLVPVKALAEYIRRRDAISIQIVDSGCNEDTEKDTSKHEQWYRVRAIDTKSERFHEDEGRISLAGYAVQDRSNKKKHALTQAINRATWGLKGLGWVDETDLLGVAAKVLAPSQILPEVEAKLLEDAKQDEIK